MACALNIPAGQWHPIRALESGTVILEMKDGPYEPIGAGDVMTETAGRASLTYLSTLAVLQLDAILQNAKLQFVDKPKPGNKHQAKFEKMLGMQYSCPGIGDVRLMVGVRKRDKTKIQYCITSLIPVSRMKKEQP